MYRFTATPQIGVKTTHYAFADNDVNGNFGTNATATGVDIDPNHYTASTPLDGRSAYYHHADPYRIGDLLWLQSPKGKVLVLATDCGSLPHGAVDLVQGVATRALGDEDDVTVTKIASIRKPGQGKPSAQAVREMRDQLRDFNEGRLSFEDLMQSPVLTQTASNVGTVTAAHVLGAQPKHATKPATGIAGLQKLLEQAGLSTDKGGADGHVDNVRGRYTRMAIHEARNLLGSVLGNGPVDDATLKTALENGDILAKLKVKVDAAKKNGAVSADGMVVTPARPRRSVLLS